jgi:hypothetical protein
VSKPIDHAAISDVLRGMREEHDTYAQIFSVQAPLLRAKYSALVKAGFTEAQAVELCKGPLIQ